MERIAEPGNGNDDDLDRIERCASPLSMDVERGKLKLQLLKVPFIYYVSTFLGFLSPAPSPLQSKPILCNENKQKITIF
mgnify:CR=1 FL=1